MRIQSAKGNQYENQKMQKFGARPQSGIPFKQNFMMPNINQQQATNQANSEPPRLSQKSQPFDNERLREDIFQLKAQNLQLIDSNTFFKSRISVAEEEIKKFERLFEDIKNTGVIKMQGQLQSESSTAYLVNSIKGQIKDLKFELNYKDEEMNKMKKNIKVVKLNELEAEKKQYQDESIKLKHLLDQALEQQLETGNSNENFQILEQKYLQDNQELQQIQQTNEELVQKFQQSQIIGQSHQARLQKIINQSDDLKKKLVQKDAQIQKLKTDCEIMMQEKFKQQEQQEKSKSRGNSLYQPPSGPSKRITSAKRQVNQEQNTSQTTDQKDQQLMELEQKFKQIDENYQLWQREQRIVEKQEQLTKEKIEKLQEEIKKKKEITQQLSQEQKQQQQKNQERSEEPQKKEQKEQEQKEQEQKEQEQPQKQQQQPRKKQKDIELEKRIKQRQKLQEQQQQQQQQQQQEEQQPQQKQQQQKSPIENEVLLNLFQLFYQVIMESNQEQTEDFEQMEMQQQIQDSLKFLGMLNILINYCGRRGYEISTDFKQHPLKLGNQRNIFSYSISNKIFTKFFYNPDTEGQQATTVDQLSKILSGPPFSLENDALMLLCAFLISDQFPIDFENINILTETNEKVFDKLAFLIGEYEILDKQSSSLLRKNFINLVNQEQVKDLFKQLQQQEEQLFKFDIQAGLKQFDIDISEKELDFIMVQILESSGKQSLADLQFTDLFSAFELKQKPKGKKKKKKGKKQQAQIEEKQQNLDEAQYFDEQLI